VLFEIDPRPFKAALDRAKGDLAQAQAQLGKSALDVERDTPLAEARAIAKSHGCWAGSGPWCGEEARTSRSSSSPWKRDPT
jgi:multidrug efflux pump subunit AcrA (membrane-fusion protein)